MLEFLHALITQRRLLWSLTKSYFKQKYVGNILGAVWAILQPAATVAIFWFVFQVGFKSKPVEDYPFILWLVAGMFPWFFLSEALAYGTEAVTANAFLVKKMVFRVSLLPLIPLLSALIIHLVFVAVMFGMFIYYGYKPEIYWLQIGYYLFALSVLLLGVVWMTSATVVFFKDIGQIVTMMLQFGFWLTPIFWSMEIIPQRFHRLIQLNPLVYIIEGYRDSMIYHRWFWEKPEMTLYFWAVTVAVFVLGAKTFQKLRPHFSDVL